LDTMRRTFELYTLETPQQQKLKAELNQREADLGAKRDGMVLGYKDPKKNGTFVEMSSVGLRNVMRVSDDEATRKACYEGMRAVGPFVAADLVEIVKLRNKLARANGYKDYYDYKVQASEQVREMRDERERVAVMTFVCGRGARLEGERDMRTGASRPLSRPLGPAPRKRHR